MFWAGFRYIYIWFVSRFFGSVSSFFWVSFWFSEKVLNLQFVDRFPLFIFFWVSFRFSEKVLNSQFVDLFPLFLGPFPLFLGPFPIFRKSCKFSVCWSVSTFFGYVSSFFWVHFRFSKKFQILSLLIGFLFFWVRFLIFLGSFPVFKKVVNSQFVDRFPRFFGSVSGFQKSFKFSVCW